MKKLPRQFRRHLRQVRYFLLPGLLAFFVLFGGSNIQNPTILSYLFMLSAILSAAALVSWTPEIRSENLLWLLAILVSVFAVTLFQLIPLPSGFTASLPGRSDIYNDWSLLGINERFIPISLTPEKSISALFSLLIPLCAFLVVYRLGWRTVTKYLPWAIAIGSSISVVLGLMQILIGQSGALYLYNDTSAGFPVGFFANVNHQASFVLMCIPFTAFLVRDTRYQRYSKDEEMARWIVLGGIGFLQIIGILTAGSLAGYLLLLPVLGLSYVLAFSQRNRLNERTGGIILAGVAICILIVATSPLLEGLGVTSFEDNGSSRLTIINNSTMILADHILFGAGLGSFEPLYRTYEDPDIVTRVYVNLAHNDYLQWIIELGLFGIMIIAATFYYIGRQTWFIWTQVRDETTFLRRAASIAILVAILHSLVDYPGRIPSILFFTSLCVALISVERTDREERPQSRRRSRHRSVTL